MNLPDLKIWLPIIVLLILALVFFASLGAVFFAQNEKKITLASDIVKTCLGFFIGLATSYLSPVSNTSNSNNGGGSSHENHLSSAQPTPAAVSAP